MKDKLFLLIVLILSSFDQIWASSIVYTYQCCNEASKIFVWRSIFVFIFGSFSDAEESSKLRRF